MTLAEYLNWSTWSTC